MSDKQLVAMIVLGLAGLYALDQLLQSTGMSRLALPVGVAYGTVLAGFANRFKRHSAATTRDTILKEN
jgi:hypothetical protein